MAKLPTIDHALIVSKLQEGLQISAEHAERIGVMWREREYICDQGELLSENGVDDNGDNRMVMGLAMMDAIGGQPLQFLPKSRRSR